jgi:hypothetical protein
MERRTFILSLLSATALARGTAGAQTGAVDVVQRFGFVPDGRTDNYGAFRRLAEHATRVRGGNYLFPPGTYVVTRHRTASHGSRGPGVVANAEYVDCDGLTLTGHGAKIRLNGSFHRSERRGPDGLPVGVHMSIFMPFDIRRSRNVRIAGFDIDGGVRGMTRHAAVGEGYSYLIALNACTDVTLEDLDLHDCQTDAILLSDDFIVSGELPGRACRDIRLLRVKCRNNARGGLAALQVWGLSAVDCEFSGNGFPQGRYGGHSPGFGVDIEPDRANEGVDVDTKTGNIAFTRCNFYDNFSAILACYVSSFKGSCRFIDCNSRNANDAPNHIIATWPGEGVLIQGGNHDAGKGCIWLSWQGQNGGRTTMRGLNIRSAHDFGLLHSFGNNVVDVQGCTITGTHTGPGEGQFIFFGQVPGGGRRNIFKGNRVFVPAARMDRTKSWDIEPIFNHTDLADNEYRTDLALPGRHFARGYDPATCSVLNERFRGAFPGPRDTFRPVASAETHDTRQPFSDR